MTFAEYLERGYLPELGNELESEIADAVLGALAPHFEFDREVCGTHCSGRRLRIDAVLRPRDPSGWYDEAPVFGLEFKSTLRQGAEALAQCSDYAHTSWGEYGPLVVFLCPAVVSRWAWDRGGHGGAWVAQRLMAHQGTGELDWFSRNGVGTWRMERAGARIWDSTSGPSRGSISALRVKTGNRE